MASHEQPPSILEKEYPRRDVIGGGIGVAVLGVMTTLGLSRISKGPLVDTSPGQAVVPLSKLPEDPPELVINLDTEVDWSKTPGVTVMGDKLQPVEPKLTISPTGLSFVDKNAINPLNPFAKVYRPNVPLNKAGNRLKVKGDFGISASFEAGGPVSLQLYSHMIERKDDSRTERGRLECYYTGNKLQVNIWDGSSQNPRVEEYRVRGTLSNATIAVRREGAVMHFMVDGQEVGKPLPVAEMFDSGEIWLGLNSETALSDVTSFTATGSDIELVDTLNFRVPPNTGEKLSSLAKGRIKIGAAISLEPLVDDPQYRQLFLGGELNTAPFENGFKTQDIWGLPGIPSYGYADAMVDILLRHHIEPHGHVLYYPRALPRWMMELPTDSILEKQRVREVYYQTIASTVDRYKGRIKTYDVSNELIAGGFGFWRRARWAGGTPFDTVMGESSVRWAFQIAKDTDPTAKYFYCENAIETNPQTRGKFMFNKFYFPECDGFSLQFHNYLSPRDDFMLENVEGIVTEAKRRGKLIRFAEVDANNDLGIEHQAQQFSLPLRVGLRHENVIAYVMWGLTNRYGSTGRDNLIWDDKYRATYNRRLLVDTLKAKD